MMIAIDCRFAARNAGLGRYTRELVAQLLDKPDPELRYALLVASTTEEWLRELPRDTPLLTAPFTHYSLQEQLHLPRVLREGGVQGLFSPHFNVPLLCGVPFVMTIHDLILHRFPNNASLPKQLAYRFLMWTAVRKARSIIAVTQFVADEIEAMYGKNIASKVRVIHEGVHPHFFPRPKVEQLQVRSTYRLQQPFFLYVGNNKQHKNVRLLLDAFVNAGLPGQELVLVMSQQEASSLSLPQNVRVLSDVPEKDLPGLYSAAQAFVTASLYEGFCLPAAEAMACGCPVIAPNQSALPEIAQGHALLIQPTPDAFAQALRHPPTDRKAFHPWGWEKTAQQTHEVLRTVFLP